MVYYIWRQNMSANFERKNGKFAIKNLTLYLIIGYVLGFLIMNFNVGLYSYLTFNPELILKGQVWRLITWILTVPGQSGVIFMLIMFFLYYQLGTALERAWGTAKYNFYIIMGIVFTILGSMIVYLVLVYAVGVESSSVASAMGGGFSIDGKYVMGCVSTNYINMSIFLAFAATYPEEKLLLWFIIPIKIKWLGIIYAVITGFEVLTAFRGSWINGLLVSSIVVSSLLNFLIYFFFTRKKMGIGGPTFKQKKRTTQYKQKVRQAQTHNTYGNGARHKCAICGRTDLDNPNLTFRFCSKCSGNKEYCEDHLFTHEHN